jgi:selenium metabolism protein YedF
MKDSGFVVLIDTETIGRGDDNLGRILMGSFLHTMLASDSLPWRIILLNGGVKLASQGSEFLGVLIELSSRGVEILSCGTCLDFFHLKERLQVGRVSNMGEIVASLVAATKVLNP